MLNYDCDDKQNAYFSRVSCPVTQEQFSFSTNAFSTSESEFRDFVPNCHVGLLSLNSKSNSLLSVEINKWIISLNYFPLTITKIPEKQFQIDLHREFTTTEILETSKSTIRYSGNFQLIFISVNNYDDLVFQVKFLIWKKLSRPNKDYYFIDSEKSIKNGNGLLYSSLKFVYFSNQNLIHRYALAGQHFRITSVKGTPFLTLNDSAKDNDKGHLGKKSPHGIYYSVLSEASLRLNFSFSLQYSNSGGASGFKKNGKWYGTVGEVFNDEADIGISAGITPERDSIIDNGIPFEWVSRIFFIKNPPLNTNWKAIFWPFDLNVWILLGFSGILTFGTYYFAIAIGIMSNPDPESRTGSFPITILIAILFEQSQTHIMRVKYGRGTLLLWIIFCLLMGAGYRSRLVNFLTFIVPDQIPLTHGEIIDQNYKLYFRYYGGIAYRYAAESGDPIQTSISHRSKLINSSAECIQRAILEERSVCLEYSMHGDYAIYKNSTLNLYYPIPVLVKSKDYIMNVLVAWVYKKLSPITEHFDRYLLQTFSSGLYNQWLAVDLMKTKIEGSKWLRTQTHSPINNQLHELLRSLSTSTKPLSLNSMYGLYLIAASCYLVSLCIFLVEKFLMVR